MKALRLVTGIALLVTWSGLFAAEYTIDSSHAFVSFTINHLDMAEAHGRFNDVSGKLDLEAGTLEVTIKADSIDTGSERRDKHLRSPDFFNTKQFPEITYKAETIKSLGEVFEVFGKLTFNGVTKDLILLLRKTGEGKDPWGNQRIGLMCNLKLNRMDYGMTYMPENLGKYVDVAISLEAIVK